MDSIPNEVLEYHIFSYFSLNDQISLLIAVCKRWKFIIEADKSPNKLLVIHNPYEEAGNIKLIQKYQPSILRIDKYLHSNAFALPALVGASKRVHTLIISHGTTEKIYNAKCLHQITTLVITNLCNHRSNSYWSISELLHIFPNLKRLQSQVPLSCTKEIKNTKQLEEVTLFTSGDTNQVQLSIPMLRIISPGIITEKVFHEVREVKDPLATLTYKQYFRYYGETKLLAALRDGKYTMAAHLLASGASIDDYRFFHQSQTYEYPTLVQTPKFPSNEYLNVIMDDNGHVKPEIYAALVQPKLLQLPTCCLFNMTAHTDPHSALKLLGDMKEYELPFIKPQAFCQMLKPKSICTSSFKPDDIHRTVKFLVNDSNIKLMDHLQHKYQFVKIWFLHDDLKTVTANHSDPKLFLAMIDKGCRIYPYEFRVFAKAKKNIPEWRVVLDKVLKYEFHKANYCFFVKSSTLKIDNETMRENQYHSVGSLINYFIQEYGCKHGLMQDFKNLVNHMDSLGNTPLISIVNSSFTEYFSELDCLLKLGADPNLHHKDQLSVIARLCIRYDQYRNDNLALLIEYGGDINAPCWFEKRMCSPLMIGVLKKFRLNTLLSMMAMGARLEYTDTYGKSILDYAKQHYNDQAIRTLRYYSQC